MWQGHSACTSHCQHAPMSVECVSKSNNDSRVSSVNALWIFSDLNDTSSERERFCFFVFNDNVGSVSSSHLDILTLMYRQ